MMLDLDPNDTFKVFVATDNHLGVYERDPERADDSFRAFETILQLAKEHDVCAFCSSF